MRPANAQHKLDVGGVVGRGFLTVIRDMGMKEPYSSRVELQSGEIGDDLTYYFASSEQVPSSVGLGVLMNNNNTVAQAGGFIIQLMPFADDDTVSMLETNLKRITSVTDLLRNGLTPEDILTEITQGMDLKTGAVSPVSFQCGCSRERVEKALILMGQAELDSIIADGKGADLNCRFCNTDYHFTTDELKKIRAEIR
jgi:molecular chaperone Hsp33